MAYLFVPLGAQLAGPVPDHAQLAGREGNKHAHDVELDEPGDVGVEGHDQHQGAQAQGDDAVAERQPVTARAHLAGQVTVLGQDRAKHRETVEGGVGGENQNQPGCRHHNVERDAAAAEDGFRQLADHRMLDVLLAHGNAVAGELAGGILGHMDLGQVGHGQDAADHRRGNDAKQQQGGCGVGALGLAEGGDAVADGLDAGQCGSTGGEGPQQQERPGQAHQAAVHSGLGNQAEVRGRGLAEVAGEELDQSGEAHADHRRHENVGGHGEHRAGFPDAAQVNQDQHRNPDHGNGGLRSVQCGDRGDQVGGGRGHGDRHGEHVIDQQCRGYGQARGLAQVGAGNLVVTAAGRVGVHVLPVGGDHREQHDDHRQSDPGGDGDGGDAGQCQGQQDFVRCIGSRGQCVRGKNGKRNPLGKKGVREPFVAVGTPDQNAFERIEECEHEVLR